MKKRPTGLTVFAVVNFVFAGLASLSLLAVLSSQELRGQAGISLSIYVIASPLLTATLLVISGVGFLRMSFTYGYIGGITFSCLSLANILVYNALNGFSGFALHIPSMIYPTLLLLFLIFKYKGIFCRQNNELAYQGASDNADKPRV